MASLSLVVGPGVVEGSLCFLPAIGQDLALSQVGPDSRLVSRHRPPIAGRKRRLQAADLRVRVPSLVCGPPRCCSHCQDESHYELFFNRCISHTGQVTYGAVEK